MGYKTKIDWCDSSWSPVTGCLHGCAYCYARRIAERFGGVYKHGGSDNGLVLAEPYRRQDNGAVNPYPIGFMPTFHRYKLDETTKWRKPRTIFVCSMADLFGNWVPDEWIKEVFEACKSAPQHRYLFLTKNPERYIHLALKGILPTEKNFWFGSSITNPDMPYFFADINNTFVSIEPLLTRFGEAERDDIGLPNWAIIGAETGNRKGRIVPEKEWVTEITENYHKHSIPVFMKESLRDIMGAEFIQEFPWEVWMRNGN